MSQDANEKELTTWGFTKGFRTGLITFILALQTSAIIYLYIDKGNSDKKTIDTQAKLYQQMIDYMRPTKERMDNVVEKVDTAATRVLEVSNKVDSGLNNTVIKRKCYATLIGPSYHDSSVLRGNKN